MKRRSRPGADAEPILDSGRMSVRGARGGSGDRPDVGEHAAGVPGREGSYEQRRAVESDAILAGGLGPAELASVPSDEGFGFRRDVESPVEAGVRLADLGLAEFDDQPIALALSLIHISEPTRLLSISYAV